MAGPPGRLSGALVSITNAQHAAAFEGLRAALEAPGAYHLPVDAEERRYRPATAAEFMLMDFDGVTARFKHRATRNYLHLLPSRRLAIPQGGPFCGGYFGETPGADLGLADTP